MSSQLSPNNNSLEKTTRLELGGKGLLPNKKLGQNFLINPSVLKKILIAADLKPTDKIIEIGAGSGTLTEALAEQVSCVVAIEKDPGLSDLLNEKFKNHSSVKIVNQDIRDFLNKEIILKDWKIVANLPFYLTSPLLMRLIDLRPAPSLMVLMVQKEVAERVCAKPPKSNRLGVICQIKAECQIAFCLKAEDFWPKPKVDAAVLKIVSTEAEISPELKRLINVGFSSPRKTLANNLAAVYKIDKDFLEKHGFPLKARAEALNKEDWFRLEKLFSGK
jgi:16S rRNA (adenine1518-N6/adenine1519-N6)-dimethyltransferase